MDSASLEGSNSTSCPGKSCCLVPVECVTVAGLLGQEGEEMGSLGLIVVEQLLKTSEGHVPC